MSPELMVAMESVTLAFLLVVLSAYIFLPRSGKLKKDWFFASLVLIIGGIIFDIIAWACEFAAAPVPLQYAGNFFALIAPNLIISTFGFYVIGIVREKKPVSDAFGHALVIVNLATIAVTVIAGFCGKLFYVHPREEVPEAMIYDDGGFFYEFPMIVCTISLAALFVLVLINSKVLGRKKVAVFSIYFLIPLIVGIIELFFPEILLSFIATGVAISIVYVLLQSSNLNELLLKEKLSTELSYLDTLTGLLNRRACDRDMELIESEDNVSVIFCDLNGLKQVNDEKGHHAGDQYLISFAKILKKYFPHDSIYRISGDEFLVVARNMSIESCKNSIMLLKAEIEEKGNIAAVGTITGTGDTIPHLIKEAEMCMYADKKNYYRQHPDYVRSKSVALD